MITFYLFAWECNYVLFTVSTYQQVSLIKKVFLVCFQQQQQQKNLEGYVGFASLPNQVYRKSVKRGFEFTLMVVGKETHSLNVFILICFLTFGMLFENTKLPINV